MTEPQRDHGAVDPRLQQLLAGIVTLIWGGRRDGENYRTKPIMLRLCNRLLVPDIEGV